MNPFIKKILTRVDKTATCWIWTGGKHKLGYGTLKVGKKTEYAHRVIFEALNNKIPNGMSLDHLCRNPSCVNPDHLEVVTHKENVLRGIGPTAINAKKTHCKRGHELAGENLRITIVGGRLCRTCFKISKLKWENKNRAMGLTAKGKVPIRLNRVGARV